MKRSSLSHQPREDTACQIVTPNLKSETFVYQSVVSVQSDVQRSVESDICIRCIDLQSDQDITVRTIHSLYIAANTIVVQDGGDPASTRGASGKPNAGELFRRQIFGMNG